MSGLLGERAVVVGAGIGGLSMAGALAKHFERVVILERDGLTASACSRPGTAQTGTRMVCWQAASGLSGRFSRASRVILPEPALSRWGSRKKCNMSGQMLA
jgi:glycine/D-amino acid oxidase-like deaminating enzyme